MWRRGEPWVKLKAGSCDKWWRWEVITQRKKKKQREWEKVVIWGHVKKKKQVKMLQLFKDMRNVWRAVKIKFYC